MASALQGRSKTAAHLHLEDRACLAPVQAVGEAKQLLGLCCTAQELIQSGQLFRAHQALARIRTEHFKEWDISAEKARWAHVVQLISLVFACKQAAGRLSTAPSLLQ